MEFLQQHKQVPSSRLTVVQFDTDNPQEVLYTAQPIAEAAPIRIIPRGGTPLLDALCRAVDSTGLRLAAMTPQDRPNQVLFVIITDGEENSSREFTRKQVYDRISRQSDVYKWQFVYLGANQDAFHEAASFGIPTGNTINYAASSVGSTNVMRSLVDNTVNYTKGAGASALTFTAQQASAAMDGDTAGGGTGDWEDDESDVAVPLTTGKSKTLPT